MTQRVASSPGRCAFPLAKAEPKGQEASAPPEAAAKVEPKKERTPRLDWAGLLRCTFALDLLRLLFVPEALQRARSLAASRALLQPLRESRLGDPDLGFQRRGTHSGRSHHHPAHHLRLERFRVRPGWIYYYPFRLGDNYPDTEGVEGAGLPYAFEPSIPRASALRSAPAGARDLRAHHARILPLLSQPRTAFGASGHLRRGGQGAGHQSNVMRRKHRPGRPSPALPAKRPSTPGIAWLL